MPYLARIALALSTAWCIAAQAAITNCLDVLRLPRDVAGSNQPVQLTGVVTLYVPASQLLFVQDATAGVYVFPSAWPHEIESGDVVEVQGVTERGRFSPIVHLAAVTRTGRRGTVEPRRAAIEELNTGRWDCQFLELEGVVQSARLAGSSVALELWTGGSSAAVLVFEQDLALTNLVDARIRCQGVAGTAYAANNLAGFSLFVGDSSHIQILSSARDPFSAPLRPVNSPFWYSPEGLMDHRIRMRGVVSVAAPGTFFLQDETGAIRVALGGNNQFSTGDLVEVAGFLRRTPGEVFLIGAVARKVGSKQISPETGPLDEGSVPKLIAVEGRVIHRGTNSWSISLPNGAPPLRVAGELPGGELQGARVRVTGVWHSASNVFRRQFNSTPVILEPAVTEVTSTSSSGWLAGSSAAVAVLCLGAVWISRKRARAASRQAESAGERLYEVEKQLLQLSDARERLGRDLHDQIIQSIYAVGLNLDDCVQQLRNSPAHVESRLQGAMSEINAVIRSLRNIILGLETHSINPREFRTALKSLTFALGNEKANSMRLVIDQAAMEGLTAPQATELIHIAREALSNSQRHGHAETTTFTLEPHDDAIRFQVEDDGLGFDPKTSEGKGFGLRNMAKRAGNLGAKFTIEAAPGKGTRIVLDIPRQKQHFSTSESSSRSHR